MSGDGSTVRPVPSTFAAHSPPVAFAPVRPARCPSRRAARPVPLDVRPVPCRMSGQHRAAQPCARSRAASVRPVTCEGVNLRRVRQPSGSTSPQLFGPISGDGATVRPVPSAFAACSRPVAFAPVRPAHCPSRRAARPVPLAVRPVPDNRRNRAPDLAARSVRPVTFEGREPVGAFGPFRQLHQGERPSRGGCPATVRQYFAAQPFAACGVRARPFGASCAACRAATIHLLTILYKARKNSATCNAFSV